ncbi:hypothetical protein Q5P01_013136 [Channa striata]|uniref:Tissue factor n=1 Tax=Channa striata TaxID=64152 RepID=A0AA88MJI1_CHASR|nr:hypothetical protein Q5P01_013136 [Channa striata]
MKLLDSMSALRVFFLIFSALGGPTVVSGVLSGPTNVHFTSYNMNLVLKWSPPDGAPKDLVYTVQYKPVITDDYREGCVNISISECDLTNLSDILFEYGVYIGKVRAQLGSETSPWVESSNITMDKDTIIGPPSVSLLSSWTTIEVMFEDPVLEYSTLRQAYTDITYNITYWKDGQREKAKKKSNIQQNRIVLSDLDPLTKYCFQVHINKMWKPAEPSATVCESTGSEEQQIPWVAAAVTFVVIAIVAALVAVTVVYRRSIYHFLCPNDALPEHFKEYLLEPPNSTIYKAMQNPQPTEIIADVIVVEGGPLEATASTCSKQPDVIVEQR